MCAFKLWNKTDRTRHNIPIKIFLTTLQKSGPFLLLPVISTTLRCSQPFINTTEESIGKESPLFSHNVYSREQLLAWIKLFWFMKLWHESKMRYNIYRSSNLIFHPCSHIYKLPSLQAILEINITVLLGQIYPSMCVKDSILSLQCRQKLVTTGRKKCNR